MSLQFHRHTTPTEWAAVIAIALLGTMGAIQVGIASGIFPSDIVWGGENDELTLRARIASLVACAILCGMAYILHRRTKRAPSRFIRGASWFIALYMALNTLGNALGKTWVERYLFGTMAAIISVCSFAVASSKPLEQSITDSGTPYGSIE